MRLDQRICGALGMEELFLCRMNMYLLYKYSDGGPSDTVIDDTLALSLLSGLVRICFSDVFDLIARYSLARPGGHRVYPCLQIKTSDGQRCECQKKSQATLSVPYQ